MTVIPIRKEVNLEGVPFDHDEALRVVRGACHIDKMEALLGLRKLREAGRDSLCNTYYRYAYAELKERYDEFAIAHQMRCTQLTEHLHGREEYIRWIFDHATDMTRDANAYFANWDDHIKTYLHRYDRGISFSLEPYIDTEKDYKNCAALGILKDNGWIVTHINESIYHSKTPMVLVTPPSTRSAIDLFIAHTIIDRRRNSKPESGMLWQASRNYTPVQK